MTTNAFRSLHESPRGYNYRFVIDHPDLTNATNAAAQDITLITLPANSVVKSAATFLRTPFADTADNAFNTTALIVGDSVDPDRFITSQELNVNGTEVLAKAQASTTPHAYATATAVVANFASMSGKNLAALNAGEVHIFLEVAQLDSLS
jgi:hypothetical protein